MDQAAATVELIKMARKRGIPDDNNELNKLQAVLEQGADPNAFVNKQESILLRFLDSFHDERCIQLLLDHGADPNLFRPLPKHDFRIGYGETPLAVAVNTMWTAHALLWTRQLLNAGAEVNRLDSHGYTALDHLLAQTISLSKETLKHLEHPLADTTTYGVIQIFFSRIEPLLECAEELLGHDAEATVAKIPVPDMLNQVKILWNRCVEWIEHYEAQPPNPEEDVDVLA